MRGPKQPEHIEQRGRNALSILFLCAIAALYAHQSASDPPANELSRGGVYVRPRGTRGFCCALLSLAAEWANIA